MPLPAKTANAREARSAITAALTDIHRTLVGDRSGAVSRLIPGLSESPPDLFGVAVCSLGGHLYQAGDHSELVTIQSVSKPFVYSAALAELGADGVDAHVGVEPTGGAFNGLPSETAEVRPANPMINAGAIVVTSLISRSKPADRFNRIQHTLSEFAGRRLDVDETVFQSEWHTGDRNRALAYLMRNSGWLDGDIDDILESYFRQCAITVNASDLAVMAATLAGGGINPVTGRRVVPEWVAERTITVMATCGLYDFSGEWLVRAGLPAKSGISGTMVALSPAQLGIGLVSPPLDRHGNSVRAMAAAETISARFNLHVMQRPRRADAQVKVTRTAEPSRSGPKPRPGDDPGRAGVHDSIDVLVLQGDLEFAATEEIVQALDAIVEDHAPEWLIIDLDRVTRIHSGAARLLNDLDEWFHAHGIRLVAVDEKQRCLIETVEVEFDNISSALDNCAAGGRPPPSQPDRDPTGPTGRPVISLATPITNEKP